VNPLPIGTITGSTEVCQNGSPPNITFTGSSGLAPYAFTYTLNGGSNQTITTSGSDSIITLPAPTDVSGVFTYELVSVQDASSTTCSQSQESQAVITVNPLPTATISGSTEVCRDAPSPGVIFTGSSGLAPYTFTYTVNSVPPEIITTIIGNSVSVPAPTDIVGTFVYELVSVQDATATACSQIQSGNVTITVNSLPTATISGTTDVCKDATPPEITFTASSGTEPYTFTYRINGGSYQTVISSGSNSATVSVPTGQAGTFSYQLVSVQDGSSTECSQLQDDIAVVTVNPLPTATISGTIDVCKDDSPPDITFTGSAGTAPYTFTYTINSGSNETISSSGGDIATLPVPTTESGTFTYTLVSVQDASSTTCLQAMGGSVTVVVNPLPSATMSGTTEVCKDDVSPNVTFTGFSGTAPYTFTYTIDNGSYQTVTAAGNSVSVPVPTSTAGVFTYDLISVQDASSTYCSQVVTEPSVVITINPLPTASISGSTIVCKDDISPFITFTGSSGTSSTYSINKRNDGSM